MDDPVVLAADRAGRRAERPGHAAVFGAYDVEPGERPAGYATRTAADQDQREEPGGGAHPVGGLGEFAVGVGAHGDQVGEAQADRDTADALAGSRLLRIAAGQRPDPGAAFPDVGDDGVPESGQESGAADGAGGSAAQAESGLTAQVLQAHQRAVATRDEDGGAGGEAEAGQRGRQLVGDPVHQHGQRRVEHCGVLAGQQIEGADVAGEQHGRVGARLGAQDLGRLALLSAVDGREHGGDGERLGTAGQRGAEPGDGVPVERGGVTGCQTAAAPDVRGARAHGVAQLPGPAEERPHGIGGGAPDPQHADPGEPVPLPDRAGGDPEPHGELGGPAARPGGERADGGGERSDGVTGQRGHLHGPHRPVAVEEHGIRVGGPDVHSEDHEVPPGARCPAAAGGRPVRPKADGPASRRPSGVYQAGCEGSVTRWTRSP